MGLYLFALDSVQTACDQLETVRREPIPQLGRTQKTWLSLTFPLLRSHVSANPRRVERGITNTVYNPKQTVQEGTARGRLCLRWANCLSEE